MTPFPSFTGDRQYAILTRNLDVGGSMVDVPLGVQFTRTKDLAAERDAGGSWYEVVVSDGTQPSRPHLCPAGYPARPAHPPRLQRVVDQSRRHDPVANRPARAAAGGVGRHRHRARGLLPRHPLQRDWPGPPPPRIDAQQQPRYSRSLTDPLRAHRLRPADAQPPAHSITRPCARGTVTTPLGLRSSSKTVATPPRSSVNSPVPCQTSGPRHETSGGSCWPARPSCARPTATSTPLKGTSSWPSRGRHTPSPPPGTPRQSAFSSPTQMPSSRRSEP